MLKKIFGAAAQRAVVPLGAAVGRAGVTPNMISVAGFLITMLTAVLIASGRFLPAGIILIAGSLLDMLDGAVARATGKGSKAGAFLDSTLDRFSDAAVFLGLTWFYVRGDGVWAVTVGTDMAGELSEVHYLGTGLALLCLVLSLMVSYVRARAEGLGFTCDVGIAERPERIAIVCTGLILNLVVPALVVLAAASAFTVAQRFAHVWRQARTAEGT